MTRTTLGKQFASILSNWNRETAYLSVGNFNNKYFNEIVNMKEDAVPFIYEELKKGPTLLVYALDKIYPGEVKCEGYVPLQTICNVWLNILSKTVKH
ncbi:MAG: hypothetical protein MJ003_04320 [Paludibacteraceae bacterium]|nr:hypothetical protein [Paludibacteraceae bacterium]